VSQPFTSVATAIDLTPASLKTPRRQGLMAAQWRSQPFEGMVSPVPGTYADATLVLVGHGSTLNAESSAPTHQHADALRHRGGFGQVLTAFWKEEPGLAGVLRGAWKPRVFIVPLFISEGYFTEEVIPRELGLCLPGQRQFNRIQERHGQRLHYCGPVGTHPSMTAVLERRALEVVRQHPGPDGVPAAGEISLFIAGHGTSNNDQSRVAIERQVELLRAAGRFHDVHGVFMEEDPRIADCHRLAQTRNVVMVPFFISDGLHSYEDIPMMLGEPADVVQQRLRDGQPTWSNPQDRGGHRIWYSRSIGDEPHLPDVILERVAEAAAAAAAADDAGPATPPTVTTGS
jgi:sirohydrochlorin cobaltochelatase